MPIPDPPVITPAPNPNDSPLQPRDDPPATIPLADCLFSVECCQQVLTLPVLPAEFTSLLPLSAPVPIPTLGPRAGLICSEADDLDPLTNQCLSGGTAMCCQQDFRKYIATAFCPVRQVLMHRRRCLYV
ncbi:hypothetical protein BD414DRAFT_423263 [Trametes punicea]|nr:hypothetical protein BD414DRAFT_423263 [Trametes punicea]